MREDIWVQTKRIQLILVRLAEVLEKVRLHVLSTENLTVLTLTNCDHLCRIVLPSINESENFFAAFGKSVLLQVRNSLFNLERQ